MDVEHDVYDIAPGDLIWESSKGTDGMGIVIQHVPGKEFSVLWCDDLPHGGIRTYTLRGTARSLSIGDYRWLGRMKRQPCK